MLLLIAKTLFFQLQISHDILHPLRQYPKYVLHAWLKALTTLLSPLALLAIQLPPYCYCPQEIIGTILRQCRLSMTYTLRLILSCKRLNYLTIWLTTSDTFSLSHFLIQYSWINCILAISLQSDMHNIHHTSDTHTFILSPFVLYLVITDESHEVPNHSVLSV